MRAVHTATGDKVVAKKPLFQPSTAIGMGFAKLKSNLLAATTELCCNSVNKNKRSRYLPVTIPAQPPVVDTLLVVPVDRFRAVPPSRYRRLPQ